jgi:hypothetical protein
MSMTKKERRWLEEHHSERVDRVLDPDTRLEKRKDVLVEIVFLASVTTKRDFKYSRVGTFKQPLTDVCDEDVLDRIYEMAQMKMINEALEVL